jgi:hypothetical protein
MVWMVGVDGGMGGIPGAFMADGGRPARPNVSYLVSAQGQSKARRAATAFGGIGDQ